jgi:hypothetical protein
MFARGFKTWCENTAVGFRRDLKLEPIDPLVPLRLAAELGVRVWRADEVPGIDAETLRVLLRQDPGSWSALTINAGREPLVVLNSAHSGPRSASDLAHELSHIVLGHEPARVDVSEDGLLMLQSYDRTQENEASWLGGCLLLPRDALLHIRRQRWRASEAAERYGVSLDMLKYRLNVTGVDVQVSRGGSRRGQ